MKHRPGMISRHWKGIAKRGLAEAYLDHLKTETFPKLAQIPGFVDASILKRELDEGTEFQIVTVWESLEAIRAFSGSAVDRAVVPPLVQGLMTSYDTAVAHYEIADTFAGDDPFSACESL
jgi:heme-degrading monooxygenase HmoA